MSLVCEELLRVRQKTTNMPFILALSFSYFTMNISGSSHLLLFVLLKKQKRQIAKVVPLFFGMKHLSGSETSVWGINA